MSQYKILFLFKINLIFTYNFYLKQLICQHFGPSFFNLCVPLLNSFLYGISDKSFALHH